MTDMRSTVHRRMWALLALAPVVVLGVAAGAGCGGRGTNGPDPVDAFMAAVNDSDSPDGRGDEVRFLDAEQWVERYRPDASLPGYTLVLYARRVPMLIDMQGRVVHSWPRVRASGRVRLGCDGRLLVIGTDGLVKEYDWHGELTWAYRLPRPDDLPHHDVLRLKNGNVLVLAQETATRTDYLHEVDATGRVVWRWRPTGRLDRHFPDRRRRFEDQTHINSIRELPDNRWFDAGDDRFRPGNILVSARNLDAVFVIDRRSGDIVWTHTDGLDFQHEAAMIPPGIVGEGFVILFNNGTHDRNAYRRSEIRVIDPRDGRLVWSYSDPTFFSSVAGSQQVLANGNVLITSSEGGRAFEITPEGEKVWEWIPPYLPMRVERVAADHCPQLAALGPLDRSPVERPDRPPWVDVELGQFAFRDDYRVETLYGSVREVLVDPTGCRELLLPPTPVLQTAYGFDLSKDAGAPDEARFMATVRPIAGGEERVLIDETVSSVEDPPFRDRYLPAAGLGLRRVELCIDVGVVGDGGSQPLHRSIFLTNPRFYSRLRVRQHRGWREQRRSRQQTEIERRQLEAIGYVE